MVISLIICEDILANVNIFNQLKHFQITSKPISEIGLQVEDHQHPQLRSV